GPQGRAATLRRRPPPGSGRGRADPHEPGGLRHEPSGQVPGAARGDAVRGVADGDAQPAVVERSTDGDVRARPQRRKQVVAHDAHRGPRCGRGERLTELERAAPPAAVVTLAGDITEDATRRRLLDLAHDRLGGLDAIGSFRDSSPATLRTIMELDFFAPAELVRESLPLLAASADPAVVLVGSILGLHPLPLHASYCAAKAALASLAGSLRAELAPDGIDVLLANLGPTASEFWDNLAAGTRPAWTDGRPLSAAATARAVVEALVRRRTDVTPGWSARGFAFAARICPRLIDAVVARRRRALG
ncbi:MAG: SDR family NAD(P)-dependent oxidoreductase, partial [Planctomycetia bacterium]|nr:SDR family NAD(P)-dependent oxidoreductase [Planctomycetia bacterium]